MAAERASRRPYTTDERQDIRRRGQRNDQQNILIETSNEWDVFRDDPIKNESGSVAGQEFMQKVSTYLKILACIITFIAILACGVISKGTLLFMTSQLNPSQVIPYCKRDLDNEKQYIVQNLSKTEKVPWIWSIIISFSIPEVLTFFKSWITYWKNRYKHQKENDEESNVGKKKETGFFQNMCNKITWCYNNVEIRNQDDIDEFSYLYWFFVSGVETCHVFGLSLLIFYIFPDLDAVKGVMLTNCICLVPGIMNFFSSLKEVQNNTEPKSIIKLSLDILSILAQITGFIVFPLSYSLSDNKNKFWAIPVSLFLISLHYWENFINVKENVPGQKILKTMKLNLDAIGYTYYKFVSLWKIIFFFLMTMLLNNYNGVPVDMFFKLQEGFSAHDINITEVKPLELTDTQRDFSLLVPTGSIIQQPASQHTPVYVLLIHVFTTLFCYIFGIFACKIRIQPISYALPINLTVPVTISLLLALCGMRNNDPCVFHNSIPSYLFFTSPPVYNLSDYVVNQYVWVWILWMLSQTWITFHIWNNSSQRMSKSSKLFVLPMYEGLLVDQSLALNRRQYEEREIKLASSISKKNLKTRIFVCATMWHETRDEMMEFLKSIFRMDEDQSARRLAKKYFKTVDPDYYKFETHIFFDDAFQIEKLPKEELKRLQEEGRLPRRVVNDYVKLLISCMDDSAKDVHLTEVKVEPPQLIPTHYGGRLVWTLTGKTKMIVHLKDKQKIRHKKRWSQVMYMYYLLGNKIMEDAEIGKIDEKQTRAENTFLLALDGDIDFQPNAVLLLVDLMKNNEDLGAACGRIHPVGSGPMVWYQMFEYAIGHWLQKATEDIIGCVLCSPGCFSLFRAEALMKNNVMKKYTTTSNEARHYVQYDQGEDRWLCTLLLQKGFSVKYSSASDAYTHCPEGFNEFYNQRRRWVPSTMANIMDLLTDSSRTIRNNRNISYFYIAYQYLLMAGTILGPGTIFLMLVGAFVAAFPIDNWTSFFYNLIPILLYMFICYTCQQKFQLFAAGLISAAYGLVMMAVLVGIMLQIKNDGILAPSSIFLFLVTGIMIFTALLHPMELKCLPCGIIYYVTVPSMYLLLIIYSIFNLNDVSWGTREVVKPKEIIEMEKKMQEANKNGGVKPVEVQSQNKASANWLGFLQGGNSNKDDEGSMEFSLAGLFKCMLCTHKKESDEKKQLANIAESLNMLNKKLDSIERGSEVYVSRRNSSINLNQMPMNREFQPPGLSILNEDDESASLADSASIYTTNTVTIEKKEEDIRDDLVNPHWLDDIEDTFNEQYGKCGPVKMLEDREHQFWKTLITKYLLPLEDNKEKQEKVKSELKDLRDKVVLSFFMMNALFVLIVFLLTLKKDDIHIQWPFGIKVNITYDGTVDEVHIKKEYLQLEPIGFVFVVFFGIIMFIQFFAMLAHRIETLAHILAAADISFFKSSEVKKSTNDDVLQKYGIAIARNWQKLRYYKEDIATTLTGRRNTVRLLTQRILQEKKQERPVYLEQPFLANLEEFKNNPESYFSSMPKMTNEERRQTIFNLNARSAIGGNNNKNSSRPNMNK